MIHTSLPPILPLEVANNFSVALIPATGMIQIAIDPQINQGPKKLVTFDPAHSVIQPVTGADGAACLYRTPDDHKRKSNPMLDPTELTNQRVGVLVSALDTAAVIMSKVNPTQSPSPVQSFPPATPAPRAVPTP